MISLTDTFLNKFCLPHDIQASENSVVIDSSPYSLDVGIYKDIDTILSALTIETGLTWSIADDGYIQVSYTSSFTMSASDDLLPLLGFDNSTYSGASSYKAESRCMLFWIPELPFSPSVMPWTKTRGGYVSLSDAQEFVQEIGTVYLVERTLSYIAISRDNRDWAAGFWEQYSLGVFFYESLNGSGTFSVLSDETLCTLTETKTDPPEADYYVLDLKLIAVNEIDFDYE